LHGSRERFCAIDQRAFIDAAKAQQNRRDLVRFEGGGQLQRKRRCIRDLRGDEIET
jgi:hypothetical protein